MSANVQQDSHQILCDMCTEDRKPAMKTCMKCEISMCVLHIQAHLTTPVLLQTHPLTEPMALCGTTKCPQHGKLLEYYCLDDLTCVCVSCAIEDQHRLHNMKTFSTAHKELVEKLEAEQKALDTKTDDVNLSLEKWEQSEREKVGQLTLRLIEAVTNLRDISLNQIWSSVSARMVSMKTSKDSIQAALKEKDTFRFLQMYSDVHQDMNAAKAVDLRKGLEPGTNRDNLVEEVTQEGEEMVEQACQLWSSLLTLIDPENQAELSNASSDLIFNKLTLGQGMSLSKDKKKLFYSTWKGKISPRVILIKNQLCVPDFSRWAIKFSENCDWTVGVCDMNYAKEMKNGDVYALHCQGKQLFSLKTEEEDSDAARPAFSQKNEHSSVLSLKVIQFLENNVEEMDQPPIIEVVYKNHNSISFFSRIGQYQRLKIVTVKITSGTVDLVPFVCLEKDEPRKDTDMSSKAACPTPGSRQQPVPTSWECYCGYKHVGFVPQRPARAGCSCGVAVGSPFFTEVLCELL